MIDAARRPGGSTRLLLLAATAAAFLEVFSIGFPPASRDRLPILLGAVALALVSAWSPGEGLIAFSFLFPLASLGDRMFGGADAVAWPVLLFLGFAAGWTFRFLYDFESAPDPSRADGALSALLAVWAIAAAAAVVRARTLWALLQGLRLRAVNVEGLPDAAAIRDSVLSFAVLAAGAAYFFILRRSGGAARDRALRAALLGVGLSAIVAIGERLGLPPGETSPFWRLTGRFSGGAVDPNALGILCGLAAVVAAAQVVFAKGRRAAAAALAAVVVAGLVLSGSRSGLALAGVGLCALLLAPGLSVMRRLATAGLGAALVLGIAAFLFSGARGDVGSRLAETFDTRVPIEHRASARPILWKSAVRLFESHPVAGSGLGSFSWQLPNLLREEGSSLPMRDNPGNAYLQALAETGAIGFLLVAAFAVALAREAGAALRTLGRAPRVAGAGAASIGMLVALVTGSHWFAPDAALLFFLLASVVGREPAAGAAPWPGWARGLAVAVYAAAALWGALGSGGSEEAFRYRETVGFHAREVGPGGSYYWTQRRFAIRLAPGETRRLQLAHYTPEGKSVELVAESGGRTVLDRTLEPGQAVGLLLSGGAREPRVVRFRLSRAFVPKRLGLSGDRRELGLVAVFPGAQ